MQSATKYERSLQEFRLKHVDEPPNLAVKLIVLYLKLILTMRMRDEVLQNVHTERFQQPHRA